MKKRANIFPWNYFDTASQSLYHQHLKVCRTDQPVMQRQSNPFTGAIRPTHRG
jgi:hypothetical protein